MNDIKKEYDKIKITQKGIEFLQENSVMQKAKNFLLASTESIKRLIQFI